MPEKKELLKTRLSPEQLAVNFSDLHPALSKDEARAEASRCLYCYDAPCMRACPTHIDVPGFIREILHNDDTGAADTIYDENIFGGSCARACPTEVLCEGACVDQTLLRAPVQIGRLQRFATDASSPRHEAGPDSGKRVAVVGSGPAGLSCAYSLRRMGHNVVVFEANDVPGGLNTFGISVYKISTAFSLSEVESIKNIGVEIRTGEYVDTERLRELHDSFDAVFLGIGLGATSHLDIPGAEISGIVEALEFVSESHSGPLTDCRVGRQVLVIGGGNTAVDVATQAIRLGAESVTIAYRRSAREMSAFAYEYELAKNDGIRFEWMCRPVEFLSESGAVSATKMARVEMTGSGRSAVLADVPGNTFELKCDMVIQALGQNPATDLLNDFGSRILDDGRVQVDPDSGTTSIPGLFAGGDCLSRGAEIVDAVQDGKIAAAGIDRFLSAIT